MTDLETVTKPPALVKAADECAGWTEQQFREAVAKAWGNSVAQLSRAGELLVKAEQRGYRMASNSPKLERIFKHLRRIGLGLELPETWTLNLGRRDLQDAIADLPVHEQRRLADGDTVPLVVIRDGKTAVYEKDPSDLTPEQVKQVFAHGRVRDTSEQTSWIADQDRKARRPVPQKVGPFAVDEDVGVLEGKGVVINLDLAREMVRVLSKISRRRQ